ncbi:Oidioi.mRNA.OKI2018_I69.chr2.g6241.t1.cds [Oikopleura dioica]|uniref:Oidioi.mRNA.OKI2018_I69.chr2.g6241.t1.cds n=1 Tax=Oikopleura dioica TaxID=34765 RepID=A0ABN7T8G5_OIKDI|nr:Oidioi.mRNA.OKI2018_I69.chr2.g6241.t1.cds [Oikopleura dioica]
MGLDGEISKTQNDLDHFKCGICFEIFKDPLELCCCNKNICSMCINDWLKNKTRNDKVCPFCRGSQHPRRTKKNKVFCEILESTNLVCKNDWCRALIPYGNYKNHVDGCNSALSKLCDFCGIGVLQRKMKKHQEEECAPSLLYQLTVLRGSMKESSLKKDNSERELKIVQSSKKNDEDPSLVKICDKLELLEKEIFSKEKSNEIVADIKEEVKSLKQQIIYDREIMLRNIMDKFESFDKEDSQKLKKALEDLKQRELKIDFLQSQIGSPIFDDALYLNDNFDIYY